MKYLNEILGIKYPLIQGGMANIATGAFAAACSEGGALGVIACGGGAMLREENAKIAAGHGQVLFLDVPFATCYLRIANTDRPIVRRSTREELYQLYRRRRGIYRKHSTQRIDAAHSPTAVVNAITELLGEGGA